MSDAIWRLAGPITYFAIGSIFVFAMLLGTLAANRRRITKAQFRRTMKAATFVFIVAALYFFAFWLPQHIHP